MKDLEVLKNQIYSLKYVDSLTLDTHIRQFNRWHLEANQANTPISTQVIKDFFDHLLKDNNKYERRNRAATLHGYKSAIKKSVSKTFKMTMEEKVAFELFFRKIKLPRAAKSIKFISIEDLQTLIKEAEPRISLFLKFLVNSGLRISEMINIKNADLMLSSDKKDYSVYIIGKGNKEGYVHGLPVSLIEEIRNTFAGREYLFEREKKSKRPNENTENELQYTRRQMYFLIEKASLEILGKRINPHMTRHTCGRILMDKLKDVNKVQDRLRHSSVRTTIENYLTTKISREDIHDAFDDILV